MRQVVLWKDWLGVSRDAKMAGQQVLEKDKGCV